MVEMRNEMNSAIDYSHRLSFDRIIREPSGIQENDTSTNSSYSWDFISDAPVFFIESTKPKKANAQAVTSILPGIDEHYCTQCSKRKQRNYSRPICKECSDWEVKQRLEESVDFDYTS